MTRECDVRGDDSSTPDLVEVGGGRVCPECHVRCSSAGLTAIARHYCDSPARLSPASRGSAPARRRLRRRTTPDRRQFSSSSTSRRPPGETHGRTPGRHRDYPARDAGRIDPYGWGEGQAVPHQVLPQQWGGSRVRPDPNVGGPPGIGEHRNSIPLQAFEGFPAGLVFSSERSSRTQATLSSSTVESVSRNAREARASVEPDAAAEWVNKDGFAHDVPSTKFHDVSTQWDFVSELGAGESVTFAFESPESTSTPGTSTERDRCAE